MRTNINKRTPLIILIVVLILCSTLQAEESKHLHTRGLQQQQDNEQKPNTDHLKLDEKIPISVEGEFKRVYFLYLYGATADDIEPNFSPLQSVMNTRKRMVQPFLNRVKFALSNQAGNSFYKRVQTNQGIHDQFQRISNLMNGSELDKLFYDIQIADPLLLFKNSKDYLSSDSIVDQLIQQKDAESAPKFSTDSKSYMAFSSKGKKVQLATKFFIEDDQESKLNLEENIKALKKNSVKIGKDMKNLDDIESFFRSGEEDIILAYDDTLAKMKLLFDESSIQVLNIYEKINALLTETIASISDDTLLMVIGEGGNPLEQSSIQKEIHDELGLGQSFLFAYSKQGLANWDFLEDLEKREERKNFMYQGKLKYLHQEEDEDNDDDSDDSYDECRDNEEREDNEEGFDSMKNHYTRNRKNTTNTNSKQSQQPYRSNKSQQDCFQPELYVKDNSIASTLSFVLGLQIPSFNSGKSILNIQKFQIQQNQQYQRSSKTVDSSSFEEQHVKIFENLFLRSYSNLKQQVNLFYSLESEYDFFSSSKVYTIDQKYYQILNKKDQVSNLVNNLLFNNKQRAQHIFNLRNPQPNMSTQNESEIQEKIKELTKLMKEQEAQLKGHLSLIVDLEVYIQNLLGGSKSITTTLVCGYIMFYISTFFFTLRLLFKHMNTIFISQKERIAHVSKQLSFVLPLSALGYYIFSIYSLRQFNNSIVLICLAISSVIFILELVFLRQKLDIVKLILNVSALYLTYGQFSTGGGLATIGLFSHLIIRIRYGTSYKNYSDKKQLAFAVFMFFLNAFRLVSFDIDSPFVDAIMILIVFKNDKIKFSDKLCFMVLIIAQYMNNFFYGEADEIYAYLVYGCPLFILVVIIQLYDSIALSLSFNKFFIMNIIFSYFLNILMTLNKPSSLGDQILCCVIYYLPSFFIIILTENGSFYPFHSCIISFVSTQTSTQLEKISQKLSPDLSAAKSTPLKNKDEEAQNLSTVATHYVNGEQSDKNVNKKKQSNSESAESSPEKQLALIKQQQEQQYSTNSNQNGANTNKNMNPNHNVYNKSTDNNNNNISVNSPSVTPSIGNFCFLNINNFGIYTLTGVLQLIINLITFSTIFSQQYLLNPTKIPYSKAGLIQYTIFQYLIAIFCIFLSNQLKKKSQSLILSN